MVERNVIKLDYISTDEQTADILTKPLSKLKVEHLRGKFGMIKMQLYSSEIESQLCLN